MPFSKKKYAQSAIGSFAFKLWFSARKTDQNMTHILTERLTTLEPLNKSIGELVNVD